MLRFLFLLCVIPIICKAQEATVTLPFGNVNGQLRPLYRSFLGIPYALPPIGNLRWKPPVLWNNSFPGGAFDATNPGNDCPVYNSTTGSEDCLTINIYTPRTRAYATPSLPVMVYIHGGEFIVGSANDATFVGNYLTTYKNNTILVLVNYRLGPLGFLALEDLRNEEPTMTTGLYGILDQQVAIRWVKNYISAFGGDPNNITIFGESAGGISVCAHLAIPQTGGLFNRAIIQSGPCHLALNLTQASQWGSIFAGALGCNLSTPIQRLNCLRNASWFQVINVFAPGSSSSYGFLFPGKDWWPVIDGVQLLDTPENRFKIGQYNRVPVILGANKDDIISVTPLNTGLYILAIQAAFGPNATQVLNFYPASTPADSMAQLFADRFFRCPNRRAARYISDSGVSAYLYHFTHVPVCPTPEMLGKTGVFHGAELLYVFGTYQVFSILGLCVAPPIEQQIMRVFQGYWTQFAATSNPNYPGGATWTAYNSALDNSINLNDTVNMETGLRSTYCDFWDALEATPYSPPVTSGQVLTTGIASVTTARIATVTTGEVSTGRVTSGNSVSTSQITSGTQTQSSGDSTSTEGESENIGTKPFVTLLLFLFVML